MNKYETLLNQALQGVVRTILQQVQEEGIVSPSSFYLTFQTNREDVKLPDFVRAKYPEEITLVLEHQFENLVVSDEKISVELSFGGQYYPVEIPFNALISFMDRGQNFGIPLTPVPYVPKEEAEVISLKDLLKK